VLRTNSQNYTEVYGAVAGIRRVLDELPGRVAVGEVFGSPGQIARYYHDEGRPGLQLAFNFNFIGRDYEDTPWDAAVMRDIIAASEASLPDGAQPCYAFGNHDRRRFITRHNADGHGALRARAAALLLLGLRSTPFIYYGEEIGMADVPIPEADAQDPARFHWENRDPERTPMQWDATPGRGFTTGRPWLPVGPASTTVAAQFDDPASLLSLYREAIRARKTCPALHSGSLEALRAEDGVLSFVRTHGDERVLVAVNTALEARRLPVAGRALVTTAPLGDGVLPPLGAAWLML
jgi:alpha-glucosidase